MVDIFSQPRGPNIDISLFPSSANAGISGGNALGTPVSNAVEGAIQGYGQGQAIEANAQQAVIRQNQIDRLPQNNRAQDQQIAINDQAIQDNQNKLDKQAQLKPLYDELVGIASAGDKQALADAYLTGKFGPLFGEYPHLGEQITKDTFPYWPDKEQKEYLDLVHRRDRLESNQRLAEQATADFDKTQSVFAADPTTKLIQKQIPGISIEDIRKGELVSREPLITEEPGKKYYTFKLNGKDFEPTKEFTDRLTDYDAAFNLKNKRLSGMGGLTDMQQDAAVVKAEKSVAGRVGLSGPAPTASNQTYTDKVSAATKALAAGRSSPSPSASPKPVAYSPADHQPYGDRPSPKNYAPQYAPSGMNQLAKDTQGGEASGSAGGGGEDREFRLVNPRSEKEITVDPILKFAPPLTQAVALTESDGGNKNLSPSGAVGIMQILPGTFNYVAKKYKLEGYDITKTPDNLAIGSIYLGEQLKRFGSARGAGLELALAAYNTGPGRVSDALQNAEDKSWEGVKAELKKMLKPRAYKEVSEYPDTVIKALVLNQTL